MPLSNYATDTYISRGIARLTECRAKPIESEFPNYRSWLDWFVLRSIVTFEPTQAGAALVFDVVRRANAAIEDYTEAHAALDDFVSKERRIISYFRAVRKFESVVANVYEAAEFLRKGGPNLPGHVKGDGSARDRLNAAYNGYRHLLPQDLPPGHLHAVWIENDGLHTLRKTDQRQGGGFETLTLTFDELREIVCEISRIAQKIAKAEIPAESSTP
jgi:hypothetical protein